MSNNEIKVMSEFATLTILESAQEEALKVTKDLLREITKK